MERDEKDIRKELDGLLKKAESEEDWRNIRFLIDEYLDEGYNIRDYVYLYNHGVQDFENKK